MYSSLSSISSILYSLTLSSSFYQRLLLLLHVRVLFQLYHLYFLRMWLLQQGYYFCQGQNDTDIFDISNLSKSTNKVSRWLLAAISSTESDVTRHSSLGFGKRDFFSHQQFFLLYDIIFYTLPVLVNMITLAGTDNKRYNFQSVV